jgi:ubiquinone/menaquinone biosynthesis C-methylase UbiE
MNEELTQQRHYWNKTSENFHSIYTKKKSKIMLFLDKLFRKDMFERFVYTIDNCKPVQGKTYLDIGCGAGNFSIELAKSGAEKVIGIDIAEKMITISRNEAKENNVDDKCIFILTDLIQYNPDRKIHTSFGIGLFDYIRDPLPVISKMYDLSEEKSIFAFPRLGTWRMPIRKVRLTLKKCDVYFYSRKRVESLLKTAGFKKYKIDKVGKLFCAVGYKN